MSTQQENNPHFKEQPPRRHHQQQHQQDPRRSHNPPDHHRRSLKTPHSDKTRPEIWFVAAFCVIFWLVIILGGLAVLIVYLAFKPRSPHFIVSSATLNAAYIDAGSLLNADLTVLANFTNPNKKVSVDFSYLVLDLYYGSTLIATRAIDPFSATRRESKLQDVHMVSSQVLLPMAEMERLKKEIESNGVTFFVKGSFRTRSNLGFLHYKYWLYSRCNIVVTGPPSGILVARQCRTKR